jgi:NAD(P)-dependent dehydrogenase (short-subunit alcohol dehydrogenase family)
VLADGLSPLRNYAGTVPHLVTTYDTILRNPNAAERLKPEVVICIGNWPTSKVLRAWIEESAAPIWMVTRRLDNRDALHGRTVHLPVSLAALAAELPVATDPNGYEQMWAGYEHRMRVALDDRITQANGLFEGRVTALLAQHLPPDTTLCIANSMPVRDMEYFWPATDQHIRPMANRGANGIDGTLSTALGVAHAAETPTVLLTGDLALLHDTNGWLIAPKFRGSLTIVLINNAGLGGTRGQTVEGFELTFGTNHLGHFLLTERLRPRLLQAPAARIINVASMAHYQAKHGIDFDAVRKPTGLGVSEYAVSKLANVLHASELARRLQGTTVLACSLHPGVVATNIWQRSMGRPLAAVVKLFMMSSDDGARTTVFCATTPTLASSNCPSSGRTSPPPRRRSTRCVAPIPFSPVLLVQTPNTLRR